jgi:hypothetical protein
MNLLSQMHSCPLFLKGTLFGNKSIWPTKILGHAMELLRQQTHFPVMQFCGTFHALNVSEIMSKTTYQYSWSIWQFIQKFISSKVQKSKIKQWKTCQFHPKYFCHTILKQVLQITKFKCTTYHLWQPLPGRCWIFRANSVHPMLHMFSALL